MSETESPLILYVDDDPDILVVPAHRSSRPPATPSSSAESAEAGSARLSRAARPDVVIVDLMMEEVDSGTSFVKELRALGNRAPIFMLSSVGDSLNLRHRLRAARPGRRLPEAARSPAPSRGARRRARRGARPLTLARRQISGVTGLTGADLDRAR